MNLKHLRLQLFTEFKQPFSQRARRGRMRAFMERMTVREGMSVLDLGGYPRIWDSVPPKLDITILNLPGALESKPGSHHRLRYVEGDACDVAGFRDRQFDTVFSNSVIEHVGPAERQAAFAREVRRLGKSYWVQTPSRWFPLEAHSGMPFWWFYPARLRRYFIERWRPTLPAWTEMVEETRVLGPTELRRLFPEATIWVERFCGIPKSYVAYFTGRQ